MAKFSSVENYVWTLQKCRSKKDLKATIDLHCCMCKNGLESHSVLGNYLIPTLVECESLSDAEEVFNRLPHPNEVSWTSLIQGYIEYGEAMHGFLLYGRMQESFVYPSKFTFLVMLKACVKLGCTERGRNIHSEIIKNGLDENCFIGNTLVDMYAKCGSVVESRQVFDELEDRDLVSWNALITGYVENGFTEEALACFKRLQCEGMSPDVTTFLSVLKACSTIHATHCGMEVHALILKEEFDGDVFLGNTLVDMYAKCGLFKEALDVFNGLPLRDIVSWNALITGHAEHEYYNEVFSFWKEMQMAGIAPNIGTCVRALQACSVLGEAVRGQELHFEVVQRGFENEFYVDNTLVDMYSKYGLLEESQNVFDKILVRDAALWNTLIAGYSGHQLEKEAQSILWEMHSEGVSPDSVTFSTILKACSSTGAIDRGQEIHAQMLEKGFQDLHVGSSLVDLYAKCGFLEESRYVLDKLSDRDVICWNALISGYADKELNVDALGCLEEMKCEGICLDPGTYVCSLQACDGLDSISMAQELHADIVKEEFEAIPCVSSALVNMYVKNGSLAEAREVFDEQISHDVISWTALIAGYGDNQHNEEVFDCLQKMQKEGVSPNLVTFVATLKACTLEFLDEARKLHALIVKMGLEKDSLIAGSLIGMYAECGKFAEGHEMLEKSQVRDVLAWTGLIARYAEHGNCKEALDCLEQMRHDGVSPGTLTYKSCLQACSGLRVLDVGQVLYSEIVKKGLDQVFHIVNALIEMYFKCGMLAESHELFMRLPRRDLVSWTSLIGGYADHGHLEEALDCFYAMQLDGIVPDVVAWNVLILGCAEHNDCSKAFELCARMQEQGLSPDSAILLNISNACTAALAFEAGKRVHAQAAELRKMDGRKIAFETALVDMYGKCGSICDAEEVFHVMRTRDLMACNALLIGYALHGESQKAFLLFNKMIDVGVHPDGDSFRSIFIVCSHAGLLLESQHYFEVMKEAYSIPSTLKHHTCVVDLLARAGCLDDAGLVLERMPFQPDLVLLHAMLSACRISGNAELGQEIFEIAKNLDRRHAAAYVLMSNIYMDAYEDSYHVINTAHVGTFCDDETTMPLYAV